MIPFEEIDERLKSLGKDRAWLAAETGRKPDSIRVALAPNADQKNRSTLLQKALSDAIEREEARQTKIITAPSLHLPDRITIECEPGERRAWADAAAKQGSPLDPWIINTLNKEAAKWRSIAAETHDPTYTPPPSKPGVNYPKIRKLKPEDTQREEEA
jgi:predicted HicB family RNase H-like nuclease